MSDLLLDIVFYSCGQDIQRLSVVTSLPHLLRDNKDECLRRVIPKIKVSLLDDI